MKKILTILLMLCFSAPAFATHWVKVNNSTKIDIDSLLMTNEQCCDVWIYIQRDKKEKEWIRSAVYAKALISINLVTHKAKLEKLYQYNKKGDIVSTEIGSTTYEGYTPDSYISDIEKYINNLVSILEKYNADEWVEVAPKVYFNTPSWRYKDNYADVWIKVLNDNDMQDINKQKVWYQMQHLQVDCNNRTLNLLSSTYYNLKNAPIDTLNNSYVSAQEIIPNTRGYALYEYVCK